MTPEERDRLIVDELKEMCLRHTKEKMIDRAKKK